MTDALKWVKIDSQESNYIGVIMREIKFRAWDKYRKRFCDWREACAIVHEDNGDLQMRIGLITLNNNELSDYEFTQFTGLKDKNGKEIYESDILKLKEYNFNFKVDFENGGYCLVNNAFCKYDLDNLAVKNGEIIGNIYENEFKETK